MEQIVISPQRWCIKPSDIMKIGRWKRMLVVVAITVSVVFFVHHIPRKNDGPDIFFDRPSQVLRYDTVADKTKQVEIKIAKVATVSKQEQQQLLDLRKKALNGQLVNIPNPSILPIVYRDKDFVNEKPDATPKIPKRIHQTWMTRKVPTTTKSWIQSWRKFNPDWEYWFWTDEDALLLVKKKYPQYLKYFTKYEKAIQKADVMRYFVLHEFGGVYADIDIAAVKSLTPLTTSHYAIVSQEPFAHSKVYWGWRKYMPCNAFMASSKGHQYLKMIVETIPRNYYGNKKSDVMNKTGPMMVGRILNDYKEQNKYNYTIKDTVYLADPDVFHPNIDMNLKYRFMSACDSPQKFNFNAKEIQRCKDEKKRGFVRFTPDVAYTDHHWMHHWVGGIHINRIRPDVVTDIKDIIPDVKNVTDIILHS
ncbi:uncharacterized protein LOC135482866 isoform X2 [Lineus longissimus]|uniref:uncharacterized protein LOC135482866 isoform X2 n=1 Tax=Lineus longissimus TaxID=88925 RepID=UPI00315C7681